MIGDVKPETWNVLRGKGMGEHYTCNNCGARYDDCVCVGHYSQAKPENRPNRFEGDGRTTVRASGVRPGTTPLKSVTRNQARKYIKTFKESKSYYSATGGFLWVLEAYCIDEGLRYTVHAHEAPYQGWTITLVEEKPTPKIDVWEDIPELQDFEGTVRELINALPPLDTVIRLNGGYNNVSVERKVE